MSNALPDDLVKQLEDYIAEVDYDFLNEEYVPTPEAIEFVTFIKMVNGAKGEENKTPVMHLKILDGLIHENDNLFVVHRGGAKTTIAHEYTFLYIAVYGSFFNWGEQNVAIYVSDTMENGVKSMRNQLEFRWQNSEFLQQYVPKAKFTDDRWEFTNVNGKKFFIRGFGASTGVRGFKQYGQRPTWCGFDDLMSDKNAKSPTILKDIEDVVYGAAMEALHPTKRKVVWTGTPFSKADSLYKAAGSGAWNVQVFPLCEQFPCTEEEYKGSWPDRFTYESTLANYNKKLKNGKLASFNQELMLRVTSEEDRLVLDEDLMWYSRNSLIHNKSLYNFYITTDFATSETQSADYSVISVWAINNAGYWFLVDGVCARQTMDKNMDDLFRLAKEYKPKSVGIEVSGQQGGFIQWAQKEMMTRNIWFNLASDNNGGKLGIRPNGKKLVRFQIVQPWFKAKRMFFPEELRYSDPLVIEMVDEIRYASKEGFKSAHDDACFTGDTLVVMADGSTLPIKDIRKGMMVLSYDGGDTLPMLADTVVCTGEKEILTLRFTDGTLLQVTDNHPILTTDGWVVAGDLNQQHTVIKGTTCNKLNTGLNGQNRSQVTTNQHNLLKENEDGYINGLGSWLTENSQKEATYIIKTMIKITTTYLIWSYSQQVSTAAHMDFKGTLNSVRNIWLELDRQPVSGISQRKVESGIEKTMLVLEKHSMSSDTNMSVSSAMPCFSPTNTLGLDFAHCSVPIDSSEKTLVSTKNLPATTAGKVLSGIGQKRAVAESVLTTSLESIKKEPVKAKTYNFEVAGTHTYLVESGIVVHNCDTVSMLAVMNAWQPSADSGMAKEPDSDIWSDSRFADDDDLNGGLSSYVG